MDRLLGTITLPALMIAFVPSAFAGTINTSGCGSAEVQSAIDGASANDTVRLPTACTAVWTSTVNIPGSKALTLDGNGSTITRNISGSGTLISLQSNAAATSRVTNFIFSFQSGTGAGPMYISVGGGWTNAKFRVDHNTFRTAGTQVHLKVGSALGLIDNNKFYTTRGGEIIHVEAYGANSDAGWRNTVVPGSDDAVYIEDNEFYNAVSGDPAYFYGGSAVQNYYGARTVFRYNFCQMTQFDAHGTAGMIGARWWEVYENEFNYVPNGNQDKVLALRAGSGVVFNNRTSGSSNDGSGAIVAYEEDSGYPALYQVGRGKDQVLDPAYVWGNASSIPVTSSSSNVQVGRDFLTTAKPGYQPYVYPHPLQLSSVRPNAPANVSVLP